MQYLRTEKRLGSLQKDIIAALRKEYLYVLEGASALTKRALMVTNSRLEFEAYVYTYMEGFYAPICIAMLEGTNFKGIVWDRVLTNFNDITDNLDEELGLDVDEE